MSDIPIQGMDFRQLRNEVQLLRDELAIMQRKYEDILYNLDDDNFSDWFIKEKNGFKIAFKEVFPDGVENESSIEVNAREISYKVSAIDVDNKLVNYSTITQTATAITSAVNAERQYTTNLLDTDYYTKVQTNSQITQSANSIYSSVSATYETKNNASSNYSNLNSRIIQTETDITLKVSADYSEPIRTSSYPPYSDKTRMYYNTSNNYYYFWNGSAWAVATSRNIYSMFQQTASGFYLKGNVEIDGGLITSGVIKGREVRSNLSSTTYGQYVSLNSSDASLDFYYQSSLDSVEKRGSIYQVGGSMYIKPLGASVLYIGEYASGGNLHTTYPVGTWNFANATVTNLAATFG